MKEWTPFEKWWAEQPWTWRDGILPTDARVIWDAALTNCHPDNTLRRTLEALDEMFDSDAQPFDYAIASEMVYQALSSRNKTLP